MSKYRIDLRSLIGRREWLPVLTLLALVIAVAAVQPQFVSLPNLRSLSETASILMLLGVGETTVILLGGIDLSVGAITAMGTILLALWLPAYGVWGLLAMIVVLCLAGALNGLVTVWAQIPSFIVTLGTLGLWSGVTLVISGASTIGVSSGYNLVGWAGARLFGVPNAFLMAAVGMALVAGLLRWTVFGRLYVYSVGRSESGALMSGVPVKRVRILAFLLSGLFAALAAIVLVAQDFSGDPTSARHLLLPSIAAVVVGGNPLTGGVGGVGRTLIGALILTVLGAGMAVVGVSAFYQQIVYGAILIGAAGAAMDRSKVAIVK